MQDICNNVSFINQYMTIYITVNIKRAGRREDGGGGETGTPPPPPPPGDVPYRYNSRNGWVSTKLYYLNKQDILHRCPRVNILKRGSNGRVCRTITLILYCIMHKKWHTNTNTHSTYLIGKVESYSNSLISSGYPTAMSLSFRKLKPNISYCGDLYSVCEDEHFLLYCHANTFTSASLCVCVCVCVMN